MANISSCKCLPCEEYAQTEQQQDNVSMYFAALVWALAQVTPGLGPSPQLGRSLQDLVFTSVVHVLALVACLFLLLQVTGVVLRLRDIYGDWPRRQMTCRAYLAEGSGQMSHPLRHHIWSWLDTEPEPRVMRPDFCGWKGRRRIGASDGAWEAGLDPRRHQRPWF
eukprot:g31840.t1